MDLVGRKMYYSILNLKDGTLNQNYLPAKLLKPKLEETNRELHELGLKLDLPSNNFFGGNIAVAKAMVQATKAVCSLFIPVIGENQALSDQKMAQDINWIFEAIHEIQSHWTIKSNGWETFQVSLIEFETFEYKYSSILQLI